MADEIPDEVRDKIRETSKYHNPKQKRSEEEREEKVVTPVVEGRVIKRERSLSSKILGFFHHNDAQTIGSYVMLEVALPAVRDLLFDSIQAGAERYLYGDQVVVRSRSSRSSRYTAYDKVRSDKYPESRGSRISKQARKSHDFGEIVLEDRREAEEVITQLIELTNRFDMATVADLYDLVGIDSSFVDTKWGWTDMDGSRAEKVRGGYILRLPQTEELD